MVDLVDQPRFFVGAVMDLGIGRVMGLTIGGAASMETDITVSFSGLSLW